MYLQGVSGFGPLQAGRAVPAGDLRRLGAAAIIPSFGRGASNAVLAVVGGAAMVIGTAWLGRVSGSTPYLTGILPPMIVFGIGQGPKSAAV